MTVAAPFGRRRAHFATALGVSALAHLGFLLAFLTLKPSRPALWRERGPVIAVTLLAKSRNRPEPKAQSRSPARPDRSASSASASTAAPSERPSAAAPSPPAPAAETGLDPRVRAALRGLAGCRMHGVTPTAEERAACELHFARLADAAPKLPISNDPRKMKELKAWGDYNIAMLECKEANIQREAGVAGLPTDAGMAMPRAPEPEQKAGTCRVDKQTLRQLNARVKCKFW